MRESVDLNHSEAKSRGSGHLSVTDLFSEDLVNLASTQATHLHMPFFPYNAVFLSVTSTVCVQWSDIFLGGGFLLYRAC